MRTFTPVLPVFFLILSMVDASCPLNFTVLEGLESIGNELKSSANVTFKCTSFLQGLHYVLVDYVASSGNFLVPDSSAESCWNAFDAEINTLGMSVNIRSLCNFSTSSISVSSASCNNVTSVTELNKIVPLSTLSSLTQTCANASVGSISLCSACTTAVSKATVESFGGSSNDTNVNTCQDILSLYASATQPKSSRSGVAECLFNIADFLTGNDTGAHAKILYGSLGAAITVIVVVGLILFIYMHRRKQRIAKHKQEVQLSKEKMAKSNCNLTWFTIDQIKAATNNFSRHNIVGTGGYGNVYRGCLPDGKEIAIKVFKNFSAAGDDDFFHEVEVISSVRHRNLVAIQGCCVEKTDHLGHQRFIICDYMPNGSLNDHLFSKETQMDWPRRQNIALGIARGLAYLHHEVQPVIIHRDIKGSNILLDANWNARVADFGLAKFTPDGATHVTTRVAGTQGYVAPEYVLYGQLTEKSDVYSFGIVLLELLTRKKMLAFASSTEGLMLTDWAWSLVKQGRILEVLDPGMDNLGPPEVLERFVLLSLLCAHPQVPCRPTLDKVLKIMENDIPMPAIPDRPIAFTVDIGDIEHCVGGAEALSSDSGFQSFSSPGSSIRQSHVPPKDL